MTEKNILNKTLSSITKKSLQKNGFLVREAENKAEAITILKELIDKNAIIGYGGSRTLDEIGFHTVFSIRDYPNLLDRNIPDISVEVKQSIQKRTLSAEIFISSANALTTNGDLILIDKWGNRNAAATYGPKKRIFVIGTNKITSSLDEGLQRARNIAAVQNNIRFNTGNPCTTKGHCVQCDSKDRLCSVTTIISKCQPVNSAIILLINEDLGF